MIRDRMLSIGMIAVILGATGLAFGLYSIISVQTGAVKGENGDDGDDAAAPIHGKDAPIKGIVLQVLSNSSSEYSERKPADPYTLLSINISVSKNSNIECFGTINLRFFSLSIAIIHMRLWLDNSIDIGNSSLLHEANDAQIEAYPIQGNYEDLSEGYHVIEFQYWDDQLLPPNTLWVNWRDSTSVLTIMEIAE